MIKFIKEFLFLREEDKLYKIPWEMIKWIWEEPSAWKYKGTMRITKRHWWTRKSPVKQSK